MPPLDDNSTLGEAKAWLQAGVRKGVICPCCTQYAKIYVRPLNSSMARDLIWLVRTYDAMGTWVDVSLAPKSFHMSREFAKLRYWDLIEELIEPSKKGARTSGKWRPTKRGIEYVHGKIALLSHIILFNKELLGYSGKLASIRQALRKRFDYEELMR